MRYYDEPSAWDVLWRIAAIMLVIFLIRWMLSSPPRTTPQANTSRYWCEIGPNAEGYDPTDVYDCTPDDYGDDEREPPGGARPFN